MSALVASLLAVGSAPAGAAEIKAGEDNKAEASAKPTFSACVGEAVDDQGFTDLGTLDHAKTNINCLAYYGISAGRTADTFDPNANVRRSEMALFLYAAAGKAGADLMGGDMMADYGDIADLGENWQNAITALARNGILSGSGGNFRPNDDITRAEMAVALVNLVRHTAPDNFVQAGVAEGQLAVNGVPISSDDLDYFADARATVPVAVDTAIRYAYELGITSGVGGGMFGPSDAVPRRDMATFIMNALAHSNLRPAGLTVQSDNGSLTASLRNADFEPLVNELVDAFYVDAAREARAFNNDGECRSIVKAVDGSDSSTCEISVLDAATDADGNAPLNGLTETQIGKGVTVWVWTGDSGDEVDEDTDLVEFDQGPVTSPSKAEKITVSPSQTKTPLARFGTAVEFTAQLQYVDGGLDKDTSVGTDPQMGGAEYGLVKHVYTGVVFDAPASANDAEDFAVDPGTGAVTANDNAGTSGSRGALGLVSTSASETLKTDAEGKITFSLSTDDPNPLPTSLADARTVVYVLTPLKNAPDAATTAGGNPTTRAFGYVVFAEAASEATTVKAESIGSYARPPVSAARPTSHGVTVTVLDQYGRPMRNRAVTLTSNANTDASSPADGDFVDTGDTHNSVMPGERRTGSTGSVRVFYSHRGTAASVEAITAWLVTDRNTYATDDSDNYDSAVTEAFPTSATCTNGEFEYRTATRDHDDDVNTAEVADFVSGRCGTTSVYWAPTATDVDSDVNDDNTDNALAILAGSIDDGEVVVDSNTGDARTSEADINAGDVVPWLVRYDDNDIFYATVPGSGGPTSSYLDRESFEALLATILDPANQAVMGIGKRSGTLAWDGYDHDDEDNRTLFTFMLIIAT